MRGRFLPFAVLGLAAVAMAIAGGVAAAHFGAAFGAPIAATVILLLLVGEFIAARQLRLSLPWSVATAIGLTVLQYLSAFVGATMFSMSVLGGETNTMPAWLDNRTMMSMQVLLITLWNIACHFLVWRFRPLKAPQ